VAVKTSTTSGFINPKKAVGGGLIKDCTPFLSANPAHGIPGSIGAGGGTNGCLIPFPWEPSDSPTKACLDAPDLPPERTLSSQMKKWAGRTPPDKRRKRSEPSGGRASPERGPTPPVGPRRRRMPKETRRRSPKEGVVRFRSADRGPGPKTEPPKPGAPTPNARPLKGLVSPSPVGFRSLVASSEVGYRPRTAEPQGGN